MPSKQTAGIKAPCSQSLDPDSGKLNSYLLSTQERRMTRQGKHWPLCNAKCHALFHNLLISARLVQLQASQKKKRKRESTYKQHSVAVLGYKPLQAEICCLAGARNASQIHFSQMREKEKTIMNKKGSEIPEIYVQSVSWDLCAKWGTKKPPPSIGFSWSAVASMNVSKPSGQGSLSKLCSLLLFRL